jgi:hypothetical protein
MDNSKFFLASRHVWIVVVNAIALVVALRTGGVGLSSEETTSLIDRGSEILELVAALASIVLAILARTRPDPVETKLRLRPWKPTVIAALFALSFAALSARAADVAPAVELQANSCARFTLCSAQTATGVCKSGSDNIVADLSALGRYTLYSTSSTASPYACQLFSNTTGYHATARSQVTSVGLSATTPILHYSGPLDKTWVECSTITGGNVTVTAEVCP